MADQVAQAEAEFLAEKPYDANNPEQVNDARRKAGRKRRARLDFIRKLMNDSAGRAWAYELLEFCHLNTPSFTPGEPHSTSFKEGERNVGNRILADIMEAAPDQYVTMIREAKSTNG